MAFYDIPSGENDDSTADDEGSEDGDSENSQNTGYETLNLSAFVVDTEGAIMEGVPVSFSTSSDFGALQTTTVLTNQNGIAENQIINISEENFDFLLLFRQFLTFSYFCIFKKF